MKCFAQILPPCFLEQRFLGPYQKGVSAFVAGSSLLFFFLFERTDTFSPSYFFLKVSVSSWRGSVHAATALLDGDLRSKFVLVPARVEALGFRGYARYFDTL